MQESSSDWMAGSGTVKRSNGRSARVQNSTARWRSAAGSPTVRLRFACSPCGRATSKSKLWPAATWPVSQSSRSGRGMLGMWSASMRASACESALPARMSSSVGAASSGKIHRPLRIVLPSSAPATGRTVTATWPSPSASAAENCSTTGTFRPYSFTRSSVRADCPSTWTWTGRLPGSACQPSIKPRATRNFRPAGAAKRKSSG